MEMKISVSFPFVSQLQKNNCYCYFHGYILLFVAVRRMTANLCFLWLKVWWFALLPVHVVFTVVPGSAFREGPADFQKGAFLAAIRQATLSFIMHCCNTYTTQIIVWRYSQLITRCIGPKLGRNRVQPPYTAASETLHVNDWLWNKGND